MFRRPAFFLCLLGASPFGCQAESVDGSAPGPRSLGLLSLDPRVLPSLEAERNRVIIVGAGVAGLTAAVEARAQGADVVVLERETDTIGGAANGASLMLFSGSSEQEAAGVVDSPDQLMAEWPSFTGGNPSDPWVRYFADHNVPDSHDWLAGLGVGWSSPFPDPSAGTTPRIHGIAGGGMELIAQLYAQLPNGVVHMGIEATHIAQDDAGRVIGVDWQDVTSGETGRLTGRALVVATGGFGWDLDRVRQYRPDLQDVVLTRASFEGADGNGLDMLVGLGAATQNLAAVGLYAHSSRCPDEATMEMDVPFLWSVPWVNATGQRFTDEGVMNDFHTAQRIVDGGGQAWMVFDPQIATEAFDCAPDSAEERWFSADDAVAAGLAAEGDDLASLGANLGVDPAALTAEVKAYNEAVYQDGGDAWRATMKGARSVDMPPFYAMPVAVSVAKIFGGVDVDLDGQVLDTAGHPMPGLYAAGELTGMAGGSLVGDSGFTGSLTAVVLGARLAGEHAATDPVHASTR